MLLLSNTCTIIFIFGLKLASHLLVLDANIVPVKTLSVNFILSAKLVLIQSISGIIGVGVGVGVIVVDTVTILDITFPTVTLNLYSVFVDIPLTTANVFVNTPKAFHIVDPNS